MFDDMFKMRYRKIPFAIFERDLNTAPTEKQLDDRPAQSPGSGDLNHPQRRGVFFPLTGGDISQEKENLSLYPLTTHTAFSFCDDGNFSDAASALT